MKLSSNLQAVFKQLSIAHQADVRHSLGVAMQLIYCQSVSGRYQAVISQLVRKSSMPSLGDLVFSSFPTRNKGANNHANPMHQLNDSQQTEPREQSKGSSNATQLVSE